MEEVYIHRQRERDDKDYADDDMPKCPICGSKPYISKDIVDGFYFGWSVGCPRYKLNDGIHGHDDNTPRSKHLSIFGLSNKEECIRKWKERVKLYEAT